MLGKAAALAQHGNFIISFSLSRAGSMQAAYGSAIEELFELNPQLKHSIDMAAKELEAQLSAALKQRHRRLCARQPGAAQNQGAGSGSLMPAAMEAADQEPAEPLRPANRDGAQNPHPRSQRAQQRTGRSSRRLGTSGAALPHVDVPCPSESAVRADLHGGHCLTNREVRAWLLQQGTNREQVRAFNSGEAREAMRTRYQALGMQLIGHKCELQR